MKFNQILLKKVTIYKYFYQKNKMSLDNQLNKWNSYSEYFQRFPCLIPIKLKCKITGNHQPSNISDTNYRHDYYGPIVKTQRQGNYGIILCKINQNQNQKNRKCLVIYQGGWRNHVFCGKGVLTLAYYEEKSIVCYSGDWVGGKLDGRAEVKEYDFDIDNWKVKYEGEYVKNYKNGQGVEYEDFGAFYMGQFKDGARNGEGRIQMENGHFFDGVFECGFLKGQSYKSMGQAFVINDSKGQRIYRKPEDDVEFNKDFVKLVHQIASERKS